MTTCGRATNRDPQLSRRDRQGWICYMVVGRLPGNRNHKLNHLPLVVVRGLLFVAAPISSLPLDFVVPIQLVRVVIPCASGRVHLGFSS